MFVHCAPIVRLLSRCADIGEDGWVVSVWDDTHSMGQWGVGRGMSGVTICIGMFRFYTFCSNFRFYY